MVISMNLLKLQDDGMQNLAGRYAFNPASLMSSPMSRLTCPLWSLIESRSNTSNDKRNRVLRRRPSHFYPFRDVRGRLPRQILLLTSNLGSGHSYSVHDKIWPRVNQMDRLTASTWTANSATLHQISPSILVKLIIWKSASFIICLHFYKISDIINTPFPPRGG